MSGVRFRTDNEQKHLLQDNVVPVWVSKCMANTDERYMLPFSLTNTVSSTDLSVFLNDKPRNDFQAVGGVMPDGRSGAISNPTTDLRYPRWTL